MLRLTRGHMAAVLALSLGACGSDLAPPEDGDEGSDEGSDAGGRDSSRDETDDDDDDSDEDNESDKSPVGQSPGKDAAVGAVDDKVNGNVPCDVAKIVEAKCLDCHGDERGSGVTFSLTKLADFHQPAPSDEKQTIHEMAYTRVNADSKKMPPASVSALTDDELKTLNDWLDGGAKGSTETCDDSGDDGEDPEIITGSKGSAHTTPVEYDDPDMTCHKFVAYKRGDKSQKYPVPTNPDFYVAFNINPAFKGKQYLKSMKSIIDNKDVIHHWLFFKQAARGTEGVTENALGAHPDGELIGGWAPGGDDLYFDPDVAIEITGDTTYQLEAHYNNQTGSTTSDASGVEICVTPNKPEHLAAVSWVGTDNISGTESTGQCTPRNTEPIHLIAGSPHMHVKGRHMKVVVNRRGGMKEVIHDEDFDFEYQRQYIMDVVINPGDTMTTTCTFSAPSSFGKGTNDEMCYFFSTHYPALALSNPLSLGGLIHGPNSCLD